MLQKCLKLKLKLKSLKCGKTSENIKHYTTIILLYNKTLSENVEILQVIKNENNAYPEI